MDVDAEGAGQPVAAVEDVKEGMCSECGDQPAHKTCLKCDESFCEVCFHAIHRNGKRKDHPSVPIQGSLGKRKEDGPERGGEKRVEVEVQSQAKGLSEKMEEDGPTFESEKLLETYFVERAKFIPLRLDLKERKILKLLEAALNVSEYTDKVDIFSYTGKKARITAQLQEICGIISGLMVASDYNSGQNLVKDRSFEENHAFFQEVFEIGRRFKIMNPERMRADYGKMIYLLQDSQSSDIKSAMKFQMVSPIHTVYDLLHKHDALGLLQDKDILWATKEIVADEKSRSDVGQDSKSKEKATEDLVKRYAKNGLTPDMVRTCLHSIGDNHSFLRTSRDTIEKMIVYLKTYFSPDEPEEDFSLEIRYGIGGARLSHSHTRQYYYVLQSLSLWREITHDFFKLWILAESDLLDPNGGYHLRDTGQGLNRVQQASRIAREMHNILYGIQQKHGDWVGSSVVHLGDHNVPNAFVFIDKYTQVPRILNPIVSTVSKIDDLVSDPNMKTYVDKAHGGAESLKKQILADFFKHGFDGSGADNFFDAGSCIDGRLTSAWNWCSKIEKKDYFPIFLLTDFIGFDGKF